MVELTPEGLAAELRRRQKMIHDSMARKMETAALNVETVAKKYCTPGESPYEGGGKLRGAPFDTGLMRANIGHDVVDLKIDIIGRVGNPIAYALPVHEGTSKMQGRPFITDAIRDERPRTDAILGSAVSEGCR
ncbi:MAG TPA: hypothetical protein HA263_08005 [Methanoregulaceae archaeon]|nr:hypothetical protein [Methanoregulaceae archaeon]